MKEIKYTQKEQHQFNKTEREISEQLLKRIPSVYIRLNIANPGC